MEPDVSEYFEVHLLNDIGIKKCKELADRFEDLAKFVASNGFPSRQRSTALAKLEEACFFAKKSLAQKGEHQMQVAGDTYEPND